MAVEAIKKIATDNKWTFSYGAGQWHNLVDYDSEYDLDFDQRKIHVLLHNVSETIPVTEYGSRGKSSFKCHLFIGVTSDLNDEDYNYKWENNIKPLLENVKTTLLDAFSSCEYKATGSITIKEHSNLFDNNIDCLGVEFTLKTQ